MRTGHSRPLNQAYDVQQFTGYAVANEPRGQWVRGALYRAAMPAVVLPDYHNPYDPTDPSTWNRGKR